MTSLVPRRSYTDEELQKLYPPGLELQLVQILMRHGERTPVSARFQNAGLRAFWPYCASVRHFMSAVKQGDGKSSDRASPNAVWHTFGTGKWTRRLMTLGPDDRAVDAKGPKGELGDICDMGSLTDRGRDTTYMLGQRLRELYVNRLKFLPPTIQKTDFLYLRSTPVPRALESLQEAYSALYPPSTIQPDENGNLPGQTILGRAWAEETLMPNEYNCRRFAALSRAFAQRAADRWNKTEEMEHLNRLYSKWMPEDSPRVAVDSQPRLSGIMDTINATDAHGPATRLPKEFYDKKAKQIMEKIGVEEWYSGYKESAEYRTLGIGALVAELTDSMVDSIESSPTSVKFGMNGCHDTTLAAMLSSLGAYDTEAWPPFTSHIAVELFRRPGETALREGKPPATASPRSWWGVLFSSPGGSTPGIGRTPLAKLSPSEVKKLDGYYVRIRYNDEPMTIPACRQAGNHLEGDETGTFCTFKAFKQVVDRFTPRDWRQQCREKLKEPAFPAQPEWAGH